MCYNARQMLSARKFVEEPIRHFERPGKRVLDLRPCGVTFVPILSLSNPPMAQRGPDVLHVHRGCVEIVYCVRGANLHFETPEREYPFLPGMVFVSRADEPHRLGFNTSGHFVYRILVCLPKKGECFQGLDAVESKWLRRALLKLPRCFRTKGEQVRAAFERIFASYDGDKSRGRRSVSLRTDAYSLLTTVIAESECYSPAREDRAVTAWVRRIEEHPEETVDFKAMSAEAQLPPGVFARRFAAVAGLPPRDYRNACRIRRAERLLEQGLRVTDVAVRLGFSSSQYFATVFKRETGKSPSGCVALKKKRGTANDGR